MTEPEKDIIRNSACGKCGAVPPFADGSRCHPHRIVPALGYEAGNVVPRCPECHAREPGRHQLARTAKIAGEKGRAIRDARVRRVGMTPKELERQRVAARSGAKRQHELHPNMVVDAWRKLTPAQRSAAAHKAWETKRQRYGTRTHCRRGHLLDEGNTRIYASGRRCATCDRIRRAKAPAYPERGAA